MPFSQPLSGKIPFVGLKVSSSHPAGAFSEYSKYAGVKPICTIWTQVGDQNTDFYSCDRQGSGGVCFSLRWKMTEAFGVSPAS